MSTKCLVQDALNKRSNSLSIPPLREAWVWLFAAI